MKKTTNIGKRNTTRNLLGLQTTPDSSHSLPFGRLEPELLVIFELILLVVVTIDLTDANSSLV